MSFLEIEHEAKALSNRERAAPVTTLLDTFPKPPGDVSDEEAERRDRELEEGSVEAISQVEFVRRVERERADDEGGLSPGCAAGRVRHSPLLRRVLGRAGRLH